MFEEIPSNLHLEAREVISEIISVIAFNITKDADQKNKYLLMSMWTMYYQQQTSEVDISTVTEINLYVLNCGMLIRRRLSTLLCLSQTRKHLNKTRKHLNKTRKKMKV